MASNPIDIFNLVEEEDKTGSDTKNFERTVVFVGEKGAGKTSLINILKASQKDEPTKPTYAMEYSFAKRNTNTRKEVVHFYEVGGGRDLTNLLIAPMTKENYKYISYVVVVDLSRPSTIMESLNYWLSAIREAVGYFVKKNSDLLQEDREYVRNFCSPGEHEDRAKINPINIPTIVIGSKCDLHDEFEPEPRKWIARMMRYYSHTNGCSLYYFSVLNQKLSAQVRTLLNNYFFGTKLPNLMQKDYANPLFLTYGADSIESMGIPIKENLSANDIFNKITREYFPPEKDEQRETKQTFYDVSKYSEPKIDSTKLEKDLSLEMERIHKINKNESPSSLNNLDRDLNRDDSNFGRPESSSRSGLLDVEANKPKTDAPIKRGVRPVVRNLGPN